MATAVLAADDLAVAVAAERRALETPLVARMSSGKGSLVGGGGGGGGGGGRGGGGETTVADGEVGSMVGEVEDVEEAAAAAAATAGAYETARKRECQT